MLQRAPHRAQGAAVDPAVTGRGFQLLVPEKDLDQPDVHLLLQKMGREAVAQRVQAHRLVDPGLLAGRRGRPG